MRRRYAPFYVIVGLLACVALVLLYLGYCRPRPHPVRPLEPSPAATVTASPVAPLPVPLPSHSAAPTAVPEPGGKG